jgi:hypothetical protein
MLGDNGSDSHDSYWCYGGVRWPPSAGSGDIGGGKFVGTSPLEFGVLVLPLPQQGHCCILTRLQKCDPIFNMGVDVMRPVFNLEHKYGFICYLQRNGPEAMGLPLRLKGSSGLQMGPGLRRRPDLGSMGSL